MRHRSAPRSFLYYETTQRVRVYSIKLWAVAFFTKFCVVLFWLLDLMYNFGYVEWEAHRRSCARQWVGRLRSAAGMQPGGRAGCLHPAQVWRVLRWRNLPQREKNKQKTKSVRSGW